MFHVGQKVVCADLRIFGNGRQEAASFLTLGDVYEIRWVGVLPYEPDRLDGPTGVRLVEIIREESPNPAFSDYPFASWRFRPVVQRKTDTGFAVLEDILKRESVPDTERALIPAEEQTEQEKGK